MQCEIIFDFTDGLVKEADVALQEPDKPISRNSPKVGFSETSIRNVRNRRFSGVTQTPTARMIHTTRTALAHHSE
jgi:hypothetical protein